RRHRRERRERSDRGGGGRGGAGRRRGDHGARDDLREGGLRDAGQHDGESDEKRGETRGVLLHSTAILRKRQFGGPGQWSRRRGAEVPSKTGTFDPRLARASK